MRVLLVSTYDLGRQPFGLASPAAWLRRDGHDVTCVDTSRTALDDTDIASAELVAFYLPMHTATRLAEPLVARCRTANPRARLAAYGLYAPLNDQWLRDRGVSDILGPEAEQDLVDLANELPATQAEPSAPDPQLRTHPSGIARLAFIPPHREALPALTEYASLHMADGTRRIVGSTEATRGCKHLCRHCPIVPVYNGTFRVIPIDVVLQDIAAQVACGAQHISFGDPDFFNGPTHARKIVERLARDFPQLTYDVTIKIEHLLTHRDLLPLLASTGCLFITSAVESVDDEVLARLAKGHTRAGFEEAVGVCREVGVRLSPTFVAFTPWTTPHGYLDLLETIARLGLVEDVAPIQLAIRLLVTAGSRLLELPDLHEVLSAFDGRSLTYPWTHRDPRVDDLQREIMSLVGAASGGTRRDVFATIWNVAHARAGQSAPPLDAAAGAPAPYLSEPWYCCAEPAEFKL